MNVSDFLNLLLDDTLESARHGMRLPDDLTGFLGAERAVAECREALGSDMMSSRMGDLLREARRDTAISSDDPDHGFWFSRELTVEWIARVVSVILMHERLPVIVEPGRIAAEEAVRVMGA